MGRSSPALHDVPAPESRLLARVTGRCYPTARGGSDLWSGRLAGGAATATKLARVAGEGRTVFPQTLTTPRHSPPSRRGARRAGWCLPRRRQATANEPRDIPLLQGGVPEGRGGASPDAARRRPPPSPLPTKHLNRTRARLEQGQASSRQAHWLAYYLPATCLLLAYYLPTTCLPLAYPLPKPCRGGADLARETEEIDEPEDGHRRPLYTI